MVTLARSVLRLQCAAVLAMAAWQAWAWKSGSAAPGRQMASSSVFSGPCSPQQRIPGWNVVSPIRVEARPARPSADLPYPSRAGPGLPCSSRLLHSPLAAQTRFDRMRAPGSLARLDPLSPRDAPAATTRCWPSPSTMSSSAARAAACARRASAAWARW